MCGPTAQQSELQQDQIDAYTQAQQLTQEQYAGQQALYAPLAAKFQSIFSQGPGQKGFSQGEENDLNAQTVEGTAENYAGAARALNESEAAEGGGNSALPTGAQTQLKEELAASAAGEQSKEETGVQEANYSQGYNEWQNAAEGLETIAAGENPLGYESAETGAGSAADSEANAIASEEDSWINAVSGAAGSIAGGWAEGGFKH